MSGSAPDYVAMMGDYVSDQIDKLWPTPPTTTELVENLDINK